MDKKIKTFVVLGMHGSGTSLIAKAMASEINMGDILCKSNLLRKNGFWEDFEIVTIDREILKKAGGNWKDPPKRESILALKDEFEPQMKSIVKRNNKKGLWGWKNPITVLTIDLWYPLLTNPHIITIFKDPKKVAKTLSTGEKSSIQRFQNHDNGITLAKEYNKRIMDFLKSIN